MRAKDMTWVEAEAMLHRMMLTEREIAAIYVLVNSIGQVQLLDNTGGGFARRVMTVDLGPSGYTLDATAVPIIA